MHWCLICDVIVRVRPVACTIKIYNGTERFKNVNNCSNTNIYSYLEISGGQGSNLYLNVVRFFNASVN
jgi:hypothetical protein